MKQLRLLSGGAAQALVDAFKDAFAQQQGFTVEGTFGAVGFMKDKLLAGEPCDLVILTKALVDQLADDGHVVQGSGVPLGIVKTGIATRDGDPVPDVSTPDALKKALLAAPAIYHPDAAKATAGIHFMKVLQALGVDGTVKAKLRPFPNGSTAMHELSACGQAGAIGCTQVTEILYTQGVQLAGLLPRQFELATVYTAGVCSKAAEPEAAAAFIRMLASDAAAPVRAAGGFV
jgi:molybdate transport system substrate-binding protein